MSDWTGASVGLRPLHLPEIIQDRDGLQWFEVLIDNYMLPDPKLHERLEKVRRDSDLTFHGVSANIGSTDPLDEDYLKQLQVLCQRYQPLAVSDHLCWSAFGHRHHHDLLPLPFTEEAIKQAVQNIQMIQERLNRQILIENLSSYMAFDHSEMSEGEFLAEIANRADCLILFDVNNLHVSRHNQHFSTVDVDRWIGALPSQRVAQYHLAGYTTEDDLLIDTHGTHVADPVWQLFVRVVEEIGPRPTLVEWDQNLPSFAVLRGEARRAQRILEVQS